jgi:hypothetical protein
VQSEALVDVRRSEGAHVRLLSTSLQRAHDIAEMSPMRSCSPSTGLGTTYLAATEKSRTFLAGLTTDLG